MSSQEYQMEPESHGNAGAYGEFLATRDDILRHKWVCSEKAGHDVGFEAALIDWMKNERANWRKKRPREKQG